MYAQAGSVTDFKGVLIRRQYKPGQKYIQLIFKTTDGLRLTVTRNPQMVDSLNEGKMYHVEGQLYNIGQKTVIREPKATLLKSEPGFLIKNKWFIAASVVAVIIVAAVFSLLFKSPHSSANSATPKEDKANAQTKKSEESKSVTDQNSAPTDSAQSDLDARTGANTSNTAQQSNRATSPKLNQAAANSNITPQSYAESPATDSPAPSQADAPVQNDPQAPQTNEAAQTPSATDPSALPQ
jgi:cytoskeletal protein RodZ